MTFFLRFAQRVFYELSVVKVYDSQLIFWHNKKKQVNRDVPDSDFAG